MLKYNLNRLFELRGINKPYSFLLDKGYSRNVAYRLTRNRKKLFTPNEIERLCLLFNCTPNDLFEWKPNKTGQDDPKYAIHELNRETRIDFRKLGDDIPIGKLPELQKEISEAIKRVKNK